MNKEEIEKLLNSINENIDLLRRGV